jgi:hypothetical protein
MKTLIFALALNLLSAQASASVCKKWSEPKQIGEIENRGVVEASGMVLSRALPGTMYVHNDSGSDSSFFKMSVAGAGNEEIFISGGEARDVEDIAYATCPGKPNKNCLFLADTGDWGGFGGRSSVTIVEEQPSMPREVRALGRVALSYSGNTPNVEALTVHPNGDIYTISKEKSAPARVYRFAAQDVAKGKARGTDLGSLELSKFQGSTQKEAQVTGMDISADGSKFVVITYKNAVEFNFNLGTISAIKGNLKAGEDYSVAPLRVLQQQESIAYLAGEKSFVYTSEGENAPILQVNCQQ